jgi:hypothetical protein
MEVHHHAHVPKKWKEYITEFVMLFAEKRLRFFVNIRCSTNIQMQHIYFFIL